MDWTADFTNDPGNDYELAIEILYKGEDVAVIRKGEQGLELKLYANKEDLIIPVEWITSLLLEAKKKLATSNRE